jgi:hypothetical protein
MSQGQPRFVRVTHADALATQEAEHASEQDRDAAAERNRNERARQQMSADPFARPSPATAASTPTAI